MRNGMGHTAVSASILKPLKICQMEPTTVILQLSTG